MGAWTQEGNITSTHTGGGGALHPIAPLALDNSHPNKYGGVHSEANQEQKRTTSPTGGAVGRHGHAKEGSPLLPGPLQSALHARAPAALRAGAPWPCTLRTAKAPARKERGPPEAAPRTCNAAGRAVVPATAHAWLVFFPWPSATLRAISTRTRAGGTVRLSARPRRPPCSGRKNRAHAKGPFGTPVAARPSSAKVQGRCLAAPRLRSPAPTSCNGPFRAPRPTGHRTGPSLLIHIRLPSPRLRAWATGRPRRSSCLCACKAL